MSKLNVAERIRKARALEKAGNLGAAHEIYTEILKHYPQNKNARDALNELGLSKARSKSAAAPPRQLLTDLLNLYRSRRHKEAEVEIQTALGQYPGSSFLWNLLGANCTVLRDRKLALVAFQNACKLDPGNPDAFNNLGNILAESKRLEEAARAFETAISIRKDFFEALSNLANVYHEQGQFVTAVDWFQKALSYDENYLPALNGLGSALEALGQAEKALSTYQRAIAIDSTYAAALSNYGTLLSKLGRHEEGMDAHRKAVTYSGSDPELRVKYAHSLIRRGEDDAALKHLRLAIELAPTAKDAYMMAGNLLLEKDKFERAEVLFRKVLELDREDLSAARCLTKSLLPQRKFDEAAQVYEEMEDHSARVRRAMTALSMSLLEQKEVNLAEKVIRHVLSKDPRNERAILVLSDILETLERDQEALELLSAEPGSKKKLLASLSIQADNLIEKGEVGSGVAKLHEALDINPGDHVTANKMAILPRKHLNGDDLSAIERALAALGSDHSAFKAISAHVQKHRGNLENFASLILDAKWRRPPKEDHAKAQIESLREVAIRLSEMEVDRESTSTPGFGYVLVLGPSTSGKSTVEKILTHNEGFVPRYEVADAKALALPINEIREMGVGKKRELFGNLLYIDEVDTYGPDDVFVSTSAIMVTIIEKLLALNPATKVIYAIRPLHELMIDIYRKPYRFSHDYTYDLNTILDYIQRYDVLMNIVKEKLGGNFLELKMDLERTSWDRHARELSRFFGREVSLPDGDIGGLSLFEDRDFYESLREIWGIDEVIRRGSAS